MKLDVMITKKISVCLSGSKMYVSIYDHWLSSGRVEIRHDMCVCDCHGTSIIGSSFLQLQAILIASLTRWYETYVLKVTPQVHNTVTFCFGTRSCSCCSHIIWPGLCQYRLPQFDHTMCLAAWIVIDLAISN